MGRPRIEFEASRREKDGLSEMGEANGKEALLVADHDAATRQLVTVAVREAGWSGEILEAATGASALALATERPVVAAVLDVEMPMLDGVKAAEAIWNYCKELPIIFYSGETPPPPVIKRASLIRKGQLDRLMAALTVMLGNKLERPQCDLPDAIVLQALLAAHDDNPLMIIGLEGEFKFANAAASELYDLPYPARGSLFDERNALTESRDGGTFPFARALKTGLPVIDQIMLRQNDGSVSTATVTAVPHRAIDGELTSVSLYTRHESILNS
jgi:CheY-like chemotaxis protein